MYPETDQLELKDKEAVEELQGKLDKQDEEDKLLHSVIENDSEAIEQGKIINESFNQGMSSFTPDMMYEKLVQNYAAAEQIYGEKLIRLVTGYDPGYVRKNIRIPEFQRELKAALTRKAQQLRRSGNFSGEGTITSQGIELASLVLYAEEVDHLMPKGNLGSKEHKERSMYGDVVDVREFRKHDRYRDIDIKKTVKRSIRRGHTKLMPIDLTMAERKAKGNIEIMYAIDASGSMRGKKLEMAKRAGVALAFNAIQHRDKVGIVVFGTTIKDEVQPTRDLMQIVRRLTTVIASQETNFASSIERAIELFSTRTVTKHMVLLTDGVPTSGDAPDEDALRAVSHAVAQGITISVVGIGLDDSELGKRMVEIGRGRLHIVQNLDNIDKVILEDYYETVAEG